MNFSRFIANRVALSGKKTFSRFIIRIAVVAVALSLTVMIATTALISGFKKEITEKIFGFWGHIHITDADINRTLLEGAPMDKTLAFFDKIKAVDGVEYEADLQDLGFHFPNYQVFKKTKGGVKHLQTFALKPGIIQTKQQIEGIILKGVGEDFDWTFFKNYLVEGDLFSTGDTAVSRQILISKQTADRLEVGVGDRFIIHFVHESEQLKRRFEVSGIYKTGLEEYDKKFALVDIRQVQAILGWQPHQVAGAEIFVENIDDLDIISDYIYYNVLPQGFYSETIREKFPPIFEWLTLQNLNEKVILGLMLVVAIINMITTLLILMLERTTMIGVLKSLGANDWGVRKIFLYYAAYIISIGLLWGNVIGISACLFQKYTGLFKLSEANYYLSTVPVELNAWTILLLNAGTLIVTIIFLILPSWLVTRITPVKAIRFK